MHSGEHIVATFLAVCKYTKNLFPSKQNARKMNEIMQKNYKRPEKEPIFSGAFVY